MSGSRRLSTSCWLNSGVNRQPPRSSNRGISQDHSSPPLGGGTTMARSLIAQSTLVATFLIAPSGHLSAQHSHSHSDTAATVSHAPHSSAKPVSGDGGD